MSISMIFSSIVWTISTLIDIILLNMRQAVNECDQGEHERHKIV